MASVLGAAKSMSSLKISLLARNKVHRAPIARVGQLIDGHVEYGRVPLGAELVDKG